jgi:nucleotide-binding universal stress UspA family protein
MKILVAIEPTADAERVLGWARAFRAQFVTPPQITLLHVVPIAPEGALGVEEQMAALDLEQANSLMARLAPESEFELRITAGSPGPVICQEAAGFDMVVVGNRGRSPMSELLLGSISQHVVHHAPCPVLVLGHRTNVVPA